MKTKLIFFIFVLAIFSGCAAGVGSKGIFGTGVSVALDPRTVGTQVDDSIMQKKISTLIAFHLVLLKLKWLIRLMRILKKFF